MSNIDWTGFGRVSPLRIFVGTLWNSQGRTCMDTPPKIMIRDIEHSDAA